MTRDKTETVLLSIKSNRIKRHVQSLQAIGNSTDEARRKLEEMKIKDDEDAIAITSWSEEIENKIAMVDEDVDKLAAFLTEAEQRETEKARQEQLEFEKELIERKFRYHKELEEKDQQDSILTGNQDAKQTQCTSNAAKLPKLTITKVDGTYLDWNRFWGQFTEAIDKTGMVAITKFSYLKEFVDLEVRKTIVGLSFTAEGYNGAKSILMDRYGKESEIVKAYVQNILDLPRIKGTNPQKIHQFYELLRYTVQSLEAVGKLGHVRGNVALTIDKLTEIRGDLVRNDDDWQNWDFVKLCDALGSWIRRNLVEASKDRRDERVQSKRDEIARRSCATQQTRACVYCEDPTRRGLECHRVTSFDELKNILATKKLCFNCTGPKHRAIECNSKISCRHCAKKHHINL